MLDPLLIDRRQLFVDSKVLFAAQPIQQVGGVGDTYTPARTCAAAIIIHLGSAKHRNGFTIPQRKHLAFIAQQHRAFCTYSPAEFCKAF
ncbi:hypothetical protein D3C76_1675880 [compost metagenome]